MTKECEMCGDEFEAEVVTEDICEDCLASLDEDGYDEDDYDDYDKEKNVDTGA